VSRVTARVECKPHLWVGLLLTLFALALALVAYALAGLGKQGQMPSNFRLYGVLLAASFLAAWAVVRRFAPAADPAFFPVAGALAGLGFAVIYRLSGDLAAEQVSWLVVALFAFCVTLAVVRDHRQLDAFTYTIGLAGIALLLLPIVPGLGRTVNDARLWVQLGPMRFQPSELAKVLIVVFLASYLSRKRELLREATWKLGPITLPPPKHLGPLLVAWAVSLAVLFFQKDLGASLLFFALFVVMLWMATGRSAYLILGLVLFAVGAFVAYQMFEHVQQRLDVWLHALDPAKVQLKGYGQVAQGEFGMAAGGIFGTGLGKGQPWLVPYASTDFIYASVGEELGLLGTTAVLLLCLTLVGKGVRTAIRPADGFGKLLAAGLSVLLGMQVFIIVGGITRLIPLTGITLPFVSYGGSSLFANFIILALLIRVSSGPAPKGWGWTAK